MKRYSHLSLFVHNNNIHALCITSAKKRYYPALLLQYRVLENVLNHTTLRNPENITRALMEITKHTTVPIRSCCIIIIGPHPIMQEIFSSDKSATVIAPSWDWQSCTAYTFDQEVYTYSCGLWMPCILQMLISLQAIKPITHIMSHTTLLCLLYHMVNQTTFRDAAFADKMYAHQNNILKFLNPTIPSRYLFVPPYLRTSFNQFPELMSYAAGVVALIHQYH